ncbi:MAG: copper amine oxidase N-terminal domain-containing protein [Syntrophomonas sp.]|nr:copper amine oxidase N-terminal domain-containing protein [Syntrophomonas sp.]
MKKITIVIILSLIMLVGFASMAMAEVRVVIEGKGDEYPHYLDLNVAPIIENGVSLVPLRAIAEDLGFQVEWDSATAGITIEGNGMVIQMNIGSQQALINSLPINMSLAPRITAGSTMVPLRFVSEALGYFVEYSTVWNNMPQIFITPYTLISDSELTNMKDTNFIKLPDNPSDMNGFVNLQLKKDGMISGSIQLSSSIMDVLQVYGVPRSPYRNLNYPGDWSGKLIYWGTFIPQSGMGTFLEFNFDRGALSDLTISY